MRSDNAELGPLFGHRNEPDIQVGAQTLLHEIEVFHHLARRRRGRGHHEMRLRQPRCGAVIHDMPILAQHQAIAHLSDLQRREHVGIDEIEEFARIGPLNVDLAQCGHIADAHRAAHHRDLAVAGLPPGLFAGTREIGGAIPEPGLDHRRAAINRGGMRGGKALRCKGFSLPIGTDRGQGHRHEGRAIGGGSGLGNGAACGIGQQRQRADIGVLALIGGHALRGVALHMLDRGIVFPRRQPDILGGHVIGEIEPGAALALHQPDGAARSGRVAGRRDLDIGRGGPHRGQGGARGLDPCGHAARGRIGAVAGPGGRQSRHRAGGGHKACDAVIPDRAAIHVTGQVQGRVPAPRDAQAIGRDLFLRPTMADGDLLQALPPTGGDNLGPGEQGVIAPCHRLFARIDHTGDLDTACHQIRRGAMRVVIAGKERHALPRRHAIAVEIAAHGAGHHDAGAVVHRKGNRPLQCACRQHRLTRIDAPEAFLRQIAGMRHVGADPFQRPISALIIGPGHRGARHHPHPSGRGKRRQHTLHPLGGGGTFDHLGFRQKPAAHLGAFLGQDHIGPARRRRQRRHQAGGPRANDKDVAMGESGLVSVRVGLAGK